MDYRFFVRDVGPVADHLLNPVIEYVQRLGIPQTKVGRFNNAVIGSTSGHSEELDQMVADLATSLVGTIRELGDAKFLPYFTVNWLAAGGYMREHTDLSNGHSFDDMWTHKVHVPLITNPDCKVSFRRNFTEKADWHHLAAGRAWLYNNNVFHSVANRGADRAHLILYAHDKQMAAHMKLTRLWTLLGDDKAEIAV